MNRLGRFVLVGTAWLLANAIGTWGLIRNLRAGVYPPDSDSISIPIFENAIFSTIALFLIVGSILCDRAGKVLPVASAVFGALGLGLAGLLTFQWLGPNHYFVATGFAVLTAAVAIVVFLSIRPRAVA